MNLTDSQKIAVGCDGHLCLVSCPGSGKTRTIVAKILRAIEQVRGTSRKIGCITYTNTAAEEIEGRLRELGTSDDDSYYEISTIHSFCLNNILRPFHHWLPEFAVGFEIITPDNPLWAELVRQLVTKYGIDGRRGDEFEQVQRQPNGDVFAPKGFPMPAAVEFLRYMDDHRLVTFNGIVYHSTRLVSTKAFIGRGMASRFAWLLIDEFQDTSAGQVVILEAIATHARTRFLLVGDPNQSIMSFAGAYPALMAEFSNHIAARNDVRLTGNYRCSHRIVAHAERLCPCAPPMTAVGRARDFPAEPEYVHVASVTEGIFEHFLPAIDSLGISLGDAAVLAPWWIKLLHLGRELRQRNVPIIGPGARPYRRSREFAQLAEHLCACVEQRDCHLVQATHRCLFTTLLNITGKPDWLVYTYAGKKTLCRMLALAREVRKEHDGAVGWLNSAAERITDVLVEDEFLPPSKASVLTDSVQGMIHDMERNNIDVANLGVDELGLYARPRDCLSLMTMHSAKGREFDAVALIDLHDGRLPDFRAESQAERDESRRLLYVGITRARKLVMYVTDQSHYRKQPSPFLKGPWLGVVG